MDVIRPLTQKLVIAFQKRMGSRLCAQIKPVFHKPELKCHDTVVTAAQVLEEVLQSWDAEHPGTALAQ